MSSCTIINARITDQVIQLSNLPRIASGSKNALQIQCTFCGKWAGCGKTAVFYRTEDDVYHVPVVEGLVTVPWEVLVDEGFFWLGFMGEDDLTRTTEAVRVEVVKGALTVATATPQEPTPDIYQQIMASYGRLEDRFNAAIAVPGSTDEASFFEGTSLDGLVGVRIFSNGFIAYADISVSGGVASLLASQPSYETDFMIPPGYAPLCPATVQGDASHDYHVTLSSGTAHVAGLAQVVVYGDVPAGDFSVSVWYGLAKPSLPELTNIRVGIDGNYSTAGDAVRGQVSDVRNNLNQTVEEHLVPLEGQVEDVRNNLNQTVEEHLMPLEETVANVVDQVNGMDADVAEHGARIETLEKGGAGGGAIVSTPSYAFAITDKDGKVALAVDEQGNVVYTGQGAKQAPLKQNGNYDAEINMFICYGQSWSTGYDASAITTVPRYDNLMLDTGIMTDPLSDLTAVATSFLPAVENTQTTGQKKGETPVTAQMHIVKQLMESEDGLGIADLSYQLLGTAPGMGSKTLAQLEKGTEYYTRLIAQVQQAHDIATAMGKRLVVQAFSWVQGSLGRTGNYAEALEQLRADIDADVKAITGQTQDVKCITWQSFIYNASLRAKQVYDQYVGAADTYPNIICAGATYHLDNVRAENLHFTSESQDWLGAYFGVAYKRAIIDGEGFEPVKPTKASKSGKILYVKFNVPQRPLVFDTERLPEAPGKGFKLYATDGTEKAVTDVTIISPDTVKIACVEDVASTDRLTYGEITADAYQWVGDNHGNLRDSQGDHIQYESGAGNMLPLHNWCVIFDKTIAEMEG